MLNRMFNRNPSAAELAIFAAVGSGDISSLKETISRNPKVNLVTVKCNGDNLFESLCPRILGIDQKKSINHLEIIKYLLECGVRPITIKQASAKRCSYDYKFDQLGRESEMAAMMLMTGQQHFPEKYRKSYSCEIQRSVEDLVEQYQPFGNGYQYHKIEEPSWLTKLCC